MRTLRRRGSWPWLAAVAAVVLAWAPSALSNRTAVRVDESKAYDYLVTVTDLSTGQPMSPPMAATHQGSGVMWELGSVSSFALKEIAENGNNAPMYYDLQQGRAAGTVYDFAQAVSTQLFPSPIVPAGRASPVTPFPQSVSFRIRGSAQADKLSLASMLVCTNDGFTGVDGLALPKAKGQTVSVPLLAYETGTELNTQTLADMMPPCQGLIGVASSTGAPGVAVSNPALAEGGVIASHAGIDLSQGGDLQPIHVWSGPVGRISVTRVG